MKAKIAMADDHVMLRNGLATLLKEAGYAVLFQASNGQEFIEKLKAQDLPQVALMDINMPGMDGFETALWLKKAHPQIKVLALSMLDDETAIIRMLRAGAKGYVLKDSDPEELQRAIDAIANHGFYHSEMVSGKLIHAINNLDENDPFAETIPTQLNEKETDFLRWACTDFSYKEIAGKMGVSPRTVDGYRDALQEKLNCKGRIGLALWAIKNNLVVI
jgi:two-component system invasion response regulator UvrY